MDKRASLAPDMPDKYTRAQSIISLGGFPSSPLFYSEDDDVMNEIADRLLTDGTKVHT